ncbi:hypothetical protein CCO03_17005 [Comamonas serinivorans]|uniref:Scaffolding protein n=1 Tax=Comamonas serinivorans TaxID=1082851 RepID=A0A1Y0ER64_9BURK|nr:hypothetical protein [Comamonas serinivorans]ARU06145.1 hypothetical protein CCO03_17005 [Comamonas serinivorans]
MPGTDFTDLTEEDLAQLSAEERAFVESEREDGGDEPDEPEAGEGADADEGAADEPEQEGEPGAEAEDSPEPAAANALAPLTPVDADDEIARLNAERKTALDRTMNGDLDPEEYARIDAETLAKILEISQKKAADLAMQQITVQQMQADFDRQRTDTLAQLKALGLDVSDATVQADFTRLTAMFSNEAAERGVNDLPGNLANANYALKEAAALMQVRHSLTPKLAAAPPTPPKQGKREFDRSTIPPTLANVPAAAVPQVSGEFDHLNALASAGDYTSLERAVARLTPEQQQRWADQ